MSELSTDQLAQLIKDKHDCLTQLHKLVGEQAARIDAGDMTHLLKILAAKQQVLSALQNVERQLDPFRDQDPQKRRWRSAEDRQRCARLVQRCEVILSDIIRREKLGEAQLTKRRDETATLLQGMHHASRTRGAYRNSDVRDGTSIDLTSET